MKIISDKARNFIYGAYLFAMVLLLGIFYLSYKATSENEENLRRVFHTHKVLTESERLFSDVKDAQRAQRGYLLTEDKVYLANYATSEGAVFSTITNLKKLTADQSDQQKRLKELTALVNETFSYWDRTIALNQSNDREAALELVNRGIGRNLAERIGELISEFEQYEQRLLEERQADYRSSRLSRKTFELFGGALAIILLSLSLFTLRRLLNREKQLTATLEERVKERTEELSNSLQRLTKTNEELDNFVYTASHDLRTPVVNLHGLQQVLKNSFNGSATSKQEEFLRLMDTSINRLDKTIKELADIAKISREEQITETLSFSEVFLDVLSDISPLIEKTQAQVISDFQVSQIRYPYSHLKSLLYNLLSNAIKYHAPERSPVVKISTFLEDGRTCLSVMDNGLGLDPKQLGKLFTMYKRLHNHVEGSGVGLTMAKRIVENKGGRITVSSTPGEGSTFKVVF